MLVLAGAGTGKTRVLTTRIAHILATGQAFPSQILAVTFTNKAAREMKQRIGLLIGEAVEGMPWLGTFHSIGVKLLRRHAELAGLRSDFTILDTDDQVRLMKQLIQAEGLDDKRWPAKQFAQMIDGWKNKGLGPADIPEGDARAFANGKGRELYAAYQERLKTLNACDFGDLLLHPIRIFRANPDVLKEYHRASNTSWSTSTRTPTPRSTCGCGCWRSGRMAGRPASHVRGAESCGRRPKAASPTGRPSPLRRPPPRRASAARRGAARERNKVNICCVGDDDQSIYGWRGAEVDNILRFEKDFPGATVIRLERNYRSTAHILGAASHLIAHNEGRLGKTLFTDRDRPRGRQGASSMPPGIPRRKRAPSARRSRAYAARRATSSTTWRSWCAPPSRCASSRTASSRSASTTASSAARASTSAWKSATRWPIFRVVAQGADDLAFERIVNVPKRGLGEATIRQIHDTARALRIPMLEAAAKLAESDELKPKPRAALREVAANFARWQKALETTPHTELAEIILEESGYTEMWKNDRSAEAPGRLENLKELIRSMEEYESLRSFLEHVALVMDAEQNAELDAVNIMTLHSAKGLEFETVFLPGWEEGLFPHQRALDEGGRSGLEEERRLAYVGLTRAKKHLHLWFVSNRRIHGLWQSTIPSRFLDELPEAHVEVAESGNSYGGYGTAAMAAAASPPAAAGGEPLRRLALRQCRREKSGAFSNTYATPGWQRAQANRTEATDAQLGHALRPPGRAHRLWRDRLRLRRRPHRVKGRTIDGELVAKSVADKPSRLQRRRPRLPPEIRQRQHRRDRRQQADHRLRQGRPEDACWTGLSRRCEPRASTAGSPPSPVPRLVPLVAEQRQDDDQAVEELDVEAAQARRHDAGLDEGHGDRADGAADDRADAAPGRRAADEHRGQHRQQIAVAGGRPPGEVDHHREDAGDRRADADEDEHLHPHALDVDAHLLGAVGIVADHLHLRAEAMPVVEQRATARRRRWPRRSAPECRRPGWRRSCRPSCRQGWSAPSTCPR